MKRKKLSLNKKTIVRLNSKELTKIKGGRRRRIAADQNETDGC